MTLLEFLILSVCFSAATFALYLWAAIRDDKIYAQRLIRVLLFVSFIIGYLAVLASCAGLLQ